MCNDDIGEIIKDILVLFVIYDILMEAALILVACW